MPYLASNKVKNRPLGPAYSKMISMCLTNHYSRSFTYAYNYDFALLFCARSIVRGRSESG